MLISQFMVNGESISQTGIEPVSTQSAPSDSKWTPSMCTWRAKTSLERGYPIAYPTADRFYFADSRAAFSMSAATACGCDSYTAWLPLTSTALDPARLDINR
jgi:hypothetical protein